MRILGRVNICGFTYSVVSFSDNEARKVKGLSEETLGSFDSNQQILWIAESQTNEQALDTLFHEGVGHGILEHSGAKEFLARELRLDRNDTVFAAIEETLIRIQTPHLVSFVKSLPKLKLGK